MAGRLTREELENNGYVHKFRYQITKSRRFDVYEAPEEIQVEPWCISYYGNGHYFYSLRECLIYAYGRGFIKQHEIERIEATPQSSYHKGWCAGNSRKQITDTTPGHDPERLTT